ncbi:MAG: cyclohexanecarboxylate-CoA ligase [Burkholderiales bacterium 70-64]|nr:MAG: cyclohexanecarboxylate-CoA ligase [Burkholderiales bacterium 70-64]
MNKLPVAVEWTPPEWAERYWPNRLLTDYLDDAVNRHPDTVALTGRSSMTGATVTLSWRELRRRVDRMAAGLAGLGVGKGEVVACQLPNWWEFVALHLACVRIGAVTNPLMPIFRQRELRYMLAFARARVLVVPRLFRNFDYPSMVQAMRADLPELHHVLVVGGTGEDAFEQILLARRWEDECDTPALFAQRRGSPGDVVQLLYTSGTTGEPKGVLHSSNTLLGILLQYAKRLELTGGDVILMASPMGHQAGFMYGLMMSPMLGAKLVLQDIWAPEEAARLIQDEGVTYTMGSTPFLADLTDTPAIERYDIGTLRTFVSSGAPIPRVLVERASRRLGARIISAWGMTETGSVTTTIPGDPDDRIFGTDGVALPGMEVRVADAADRALPPGTEGRLQCRGIGNFVGYFMRPDLSQPTADGWFDTGDLAVMLEGGYIRITGRAKDILIRGGENIPVIEVENALYRHPAIREVAIVGMPDARLGERACAFVSLHPGRSLDMAEMVAFLDTQQMARQYFPERLEVLDELPHTASGKIQKFHLRELARSLEPAAG